MQTDQVVSPVGVVEQAMGRPVDAAEHAVRLGEDEGDAVAACGGCERFDDGGRDGDATRVPG